MYGLGALYLLLSFNQFGNETIYLAYDLSTLVCSVILLVVLAFLAIKLVTLGTILVHHIL